MDDAGAEGRRPDEMKARGSGTRPDRGEESTPGVAENHAEWDKGIEANREWYASKRKVKG
jgi:hypothetical protein